ncbi:MAG: 30S ribosomal protein S7 [Bacteroidota bacterium]|nr:30S ribosomal protein S7 [Bacteroidota bacterium]
MRKEKIKKRTIIPDSRYKEELVTQFVNNMMIHGKKNKTFEIFYNALDIVDERKKNIEESALDIWKKSMQNIAPQVEVKSRRIGGATFQVPREINSDKKKVVAMKNMILFARKRRGKSMAEKLASEILDGYNEEGGAFRKKEETHRMADANKAFAHFRV